MAEKLNINDEMLEMGDVKISEEVISVVAGVAVTEVEGVSVANSIADGIVEKFVKKNYGKGIRVALAEKEVSVDVHVVVDYGIKIPDAAWQLQEIIKKNIENMTDLTVAKVNIFVESISIEREKAEMKEARRVTKEEKKAAKAAKKAAATEEANEEK